MQHKYSIQFKYNTIAQYGNERKQKKGKKRKKRAKWVLGCKFITSQTLAEGERESRVRIASVAWHIASVHRAV